MDKLLHNKSNKQTRLDKLQTVKENLLMANTMTKGVNGLQKIRDMMHIKNFLEKDIPQLLAMTSNKTHEITPTQIEELYKILQALYKTKSIIHTDSFQKLQTTIGDMFPDIYQARQEYIRNPDDQNKDIVVTSYQQTSPNIKYLLEWDIHAATHPKINYPQSLHIQNDIDTLPVGRRKEYQKKLQDFMDASTKAEVCRTYVYQRKVPKEYLQQLFVAAQNKKQALYDTQENITQDIIQKLSKVYPGIIQADNFEQYYGSITNLLYTHYTGEKAEIFTQQKSKNSYAYASKIIILTILQLFVVSKDLKDKTVA